jgi:hypothetical protein
MRTNEVLEGMVSWFKQRGTAESVRDRSDFQKGWDLAISTAAEYLRRRLDYSDESLCAELFALITPVKHRNPEMRPCRLKAKKRTPEASAS